MGITLLLCLDSAGIVRDRTKGKHPVSFKTTARSLECRTHNLHDLILQSVLPDILINAPYTASRKSKQVRREAIRFLEKTKSDFLDNRFANNYVKHDIAARLEWIHWADEELITQKAVLSEEIK